MLLQTALSFGSEAMTTDSINSLFLMGIKGLFLIGVLIYFIFALIIVRQIHVMKKTLITPFSPFVQTIGYTHLFFVGTVGIIFLLVL